MLPPSNGHLYLADYGSTDRRLTDHMDSLFQDCTTHIVIVGVILNISMCICVSVLYLWYITTYKYISTSQARSIFTVQTLQSLIAIVVIDVYITTSTRQKCVLKAWKYYVHTVNHTVSHSPTLVLHGQIAIFAQGRYCLCCTKIVVWPHETGAGNG